MRRHRLLVPVRATVVALAATAALAAGPSLTTVAATAGEVAAASPPGAGPGVSAPGGWEEPLVVDATRGAGASRLLATRAGTHASWQRPRTRAHWVAHRAPGPAAEWTAPRSLPDWRSGLQRGPLLGLGRAGAVLFESRQVGDRTFYWELAADGTTSERQAFPFRSFMPTTADSAGRRWLVAGTSQGTPGRAYLAVRGPQGGWRVSEPLPGPPSSEVVGAWFDRAGRPHLLVVRAVADTRAGEGRGDRQRPVVEAVLARDGGWSRLRTVACTLDGDSGERPLVVANADGDVTLAYAVLTDGDRATTELKTRPAGGSWSDPVGVPELRPDLGIDAAGRTVVVLVRPWEQVRLARLDTEGTLDGWQQLTGPTFDVTYGPLPLSVGPTGVAVVTLNGDRADPGGSTSTLRTLRCAPGSACELVQDFDGPPAYPLTHVGPDGAAHLLADQESLCGGPGLCSRRLAAPAPADADPAG